MHKAIIRLLTVAVIICSAQTAYGWKMYSANPSDSVQGSLLGSSFVDILYHEGILWTASSAGLGYSADQGVTWKTITTDSGLNSNDLSAIFGRPGQMWAAGSHFQMYLGVNYPFGDGINISADSGRTWSSTTPTEASSFAQLVYDLAGNDSNTYAACFHGGLIVSNDFGQTWGHVYYSPSDSSDFVADDWADLETGRYYSCAVDTLRQDTLVVWAGSAGGLHEFLYLPKRDKLGSKRIYSIATDSNTLYFAGDGGVTRTDTLIGNFFTADTANGLPDGEVKKLALFGGKLWAGVFNAADSTGMGLYASSDSCRNWTQVGAGLFEGTGTGVFDFKDYLGNVFYIAAGDSGAYRSLDSGTNWTRFFVDSADMSPSSPRNQVYSIDVDGDSLFLGTRAGLVTAAFTAPFTITGDTVITFPESDSTGSFVSFVRHHTGTRTFTWVGVTPQTESGRYNTYFRSADSGSFWATLFAPSLHGTELFDLIAQDSVSYLATSSGLFFNRNTPSQVDLYEYQVADPTTGLTLASYEFRSVAIAARRLYTGTTGGCAYSITSSNWRVFVANTDLRRHDLALNRTSFNSGLSGDWVVALAVQPYHDTAVVWAACRKVPDSADQSNGVSFSRDFGASWQTVLPQLSVWNFAYDQHGVVYAASSEGLYYASPPWTDWTRADIIDPVTQDTIVSATEVYSVSVADSILWVGTGSGLARRPLDNPSGWEVIRVFKPVEQADEVFAAPVPYSPLNNSGRLTIHYRVDASAEVTVEIYDFAMNLVKTVAENKSRAGGNAYYETWDGYNENGDMVATGIYYFKISYSTGDVRWGRLAIVP
ncbi:MAG: FlgD immunoglobulin-like domain containing protein [candidate division Zixibacteria bacterium]|nr:FlgD immunoglobulin-like domain containing protein [candidate division Zixibacteria bacterium]